MPTHANTPLPQPTPLDDANGAIDTIVDQWRRERPDLDLAPMATIARFGRCAALLQRRLNACFERFDLSMWEFDVLAALRRAGAPHCLSPTALFSSLMITSGTMTHRLRRLESTGLVERLPNPQDARSLLVQLTPAGLALVNDVVVAHLDNERAILASVPPATQAALAEHLPILLAALAGDASDDAAPVAQKSAAPQPRPCVTQDDAGPLPSR